jgi:uncharacterized protein YggE
MRMKFGIVMAILFCSASTAFSQEIQVSRQNKTIEVRIKETISVEADVADVTIGCLTYGDTHDQTYNDNLRSADKVLKAILAFGIPKESITSTRVELSENDSGERDAKAAKQTTPRKFKAHQSWKIRVPAGDAQKLIDIAIRAGANGIESVEWNVKDPASLEARARAAAIEKAHTVASDLAKGLGAKVGEPLMVSNEIDEITYVSKRGGTGKPDYTDQHGVFETPEFALELFPEKIEKEATIYVVFALESSSDK